MTTTLAAPRDVGRAHTGGRSWPVGWPLFALFGGFPLWWVLGFSEVACLIFAVPMALALRRRGSPYVQRGFGVWLLFLVWVVGGILVLHVHAPGTAPGTSDTRYLTFVYRLLWYLAATVVLLYIANFRKEISSRRIASSLGTMFVVVVAGGVLGTVAPHFEFRSLLEIILPNGVAGNGFVRSLIHPVSAQVQDFLGFDEARPSAPFAYTNEWGLAIACFLPYFVVSWCRRDAGWKRIAAVPILIVATITVVHSLNRGLWLALIAMAAFVAVRSAVMGRIKALVLLLGGAVAATAVVLASPLGSLVADRLAHPHSNEGRANLGALTFSSVLHGSPLMGFGSTRDVQGNFSSIAAAASAHCPGCSPPPLGTQGHLWLVLFSQGFIGLALYLLFIIGMLVRHIRLDSPYVTAALCALVAHLVTMSVYDTIGPALFAIMISIALLWRARVAEPELHPPPEIPLQSYLRGVRRYGATVVVALIVGVTAGAGVAMLRGVPAVATQSVFLPTAGAASSAVGGVTMDTDAQFVTSSTVLRSVAESTRFTGSLSSLANRFTVTATPNSRILHISFVAPTSGQAVTGVTSATRAYLASRPRLDTIAGAEGGPGVVVRSASVSRDESVLVIDAASGGMLAVLALLLSLQFVAVRRQTAGSAKALADATSLPVLATVNRTPDGHVAARSLDRLRRTTASVSVSGVFSASTAQGAPVVAADLEGIVTSDSSLARGRALLLATRKTRLEDVQSTRASLESSGQRIVGLILVESR